MLRAAASFASAAEVFEATGHRVAQWALSGADRARSAAEAFQDGGLCLTSAPVGQI